jgi:hypothetical protein
MLNLVHINDTVIPFLTIHLFHNEKSVPIREAVSLEGDNKFISKLKGPLRA